MTSSTYQLELRDVLSLHGTSLQHSLHDYDSSGNDADMLAASGDCFVTLATILDDINNGRDSAVLPQAELEWVIKVLLQLQRHYTLAKKRPRGGNYA